VQISACVALLQQLEALRTVFLPTFLTTSRPTLNFFQPCTLLSSCASSASLRGTADMPSGLALDMPPPGALRFASMCPCSYVNNDSAGGCCALQ
jgi:hypothetical protein